jgi:hypothetical protein
VEILNVMRRALPILLAVLFAAPAAASRLPTTSAADGALSVSDGRGQVTLGGRTGMLGGVIGRLDSGCVSLTDLTPDDLSFPLVWGDDDPQVDLPRGGVKYCGVNVRFRLIGGRFRVTVTGRLGEPGARGIDLSAVGVGEGTIVATDPRLPGVYSLDGDDCRSPRAVCKPLPLERTPFKLGTAPAAEREKSIQRVDRSD